MAAAGSPSNMRFGLTPRRLRQLWYAPLLVLSMGLMMLRMLVMARLFDLPAFAEFSGGILVSGTFCMLGAFGLQSMLQREWPVNLVRRQERRGMVRAVQCNLVALGCCVAGLVAAAMGASLAGIAPSLLAVGLLHGLSQQVFLVATVESRSRGDALRFAQQNLLRASAALGLSVAAALYTGSAKTALLVDAVATILMSAAFLWRSLSRTRLSAILICALALRRLPRVQWRSALTLMSVMVIGFGLLNADRWIASDQLDGPGFAQYSFAWIVLSIAQSAQVVINASVYPLVARRYAEHGRGVAFSVCLRTSVALLVAGAVAALPIGYALELGVRRWYPRFVDSTVLLPLFLAIAVLRVSDFWSGFLLIVGFERRLLNLNLGAAVFGLAIWMCWTQPWTGSPIGPTQVGGLAVLLTISAYVAVAVASWQTRRD